MDLQNKSRQFRLNNEAACFYILCNFGFEKGNILLKNLHLFH